MRQALEHVAEAEVKARGLVVDLGVQRFGSVEAECAERENEAEPGADAVPQVTQPKLAAIEDALLRFGKRDGGPERILSETPDRVGR